MPERLTFTPVTQHNVADFEAFFTSPGAPHFCWCMVWRRTTEESHRHTPAGRKQQMMQRIAAGTPIGLIARDGDQPTGWVSIAPRETYRNLGGPTAKPGEIIWSIACFYVPRKRRGDGTVPPPHRGRHRPRKSGGRHDRGSLSRPTRRPELPLHGLHPGLRAGRLHRPRHGRHKASRHATGGVATRLSSREGGDPVHAALSVATGCPPAQP